MTDERPPEAEPEAEPVPDALDGEQAGDDEEEEASTERLFDEVGLDEVGGLQRRTTASSTGPAPKAAPTGGLGPGAESERGGHVVRTYRMGVSGTALALAWARQENAPDGATVVVEREVSPLGRLGKLWSTAPESTLSIAVVLRPSLSADEADAAWLLAGVAVAAGAEAASGRKVATWWPDLIVDAESAAPLGTVKLDIQLGPGKVRSAVATIRLDLDALGVGADGRDALLDAVLAGFDEQSASLGEGAEAVAAAYDARCGLLGRRVKVTMRPKGEARGRAKRVDRLARLELESTTGMVQKVAIDALRDLDAV